MGLKINFGITMEELVGQPPTAKASGLAPNPAPTGAEVGVSGLIDCSPSPRPSCLSERL
jgi:hypothetical protein